MSDGLLCLIHKSGYRQRAGPMRIKIEEQTAIGLGCVLAARRSDDPSEGHNEKLMSAGTEGQYTSRKHPSEWLGTAVRRISAWVQSRQYTIAS